MAGMSEDINAPQPPLKLRGGAEGRGSYDVELFEERAAIMEFDGGMTREEAERKAGEMIHKGPNV